jgi:capsule polysaccharide export protein KpsE/RkpR
MAIDLALVRRSEEQLATNQDQLTRKQEQMAPAVASLQAAAQDLSKQILALASPAPKAANVPPPKPLQPAAR